jgi:hypothetical protein
MNPDELCICSHTYEVHFGHDCSAIFHNGTPCPCKQFVLCSLAVEMFEVLKKIAAHPVRPGCRDCQLKVAIASRMIAQTKAP